jgi:hypothetical protein
MRKLLIALLTLVTITGFSQGQKLYNASFVKPKLGQSAAFEQAWKTHVLKFHGSDRKVSVFEVLTGKHAGTYQLIDGPSAWADMDKEKTATAAHDADWEKSIAPKLESADGDYVYRHADTLSYQGDVSAEKSQVTIYNIKSGKFADFTAETKRGVEVNKKINAPWTYNTYVRQLSGSSPQMVVVSNYKDGFKQMESGYYPSTGDAFKKAYLEMYSQASWDKRMTMQQDLLENYETFLRKYRADLSKN